MEQLTADPANEGREAKEQRIKKFFELDSEQERQLKEKIEKLKGLVRVFIHPDFEEYSDFDFVYKEEREVLKAEEQAFQRIISSKSEKLPPVFIFNGAKNKKEFEEKEARLNKLTENDLYIIRTENANPTPLPPDKESDYRFRFANTTNKPTDKERLQMWDWLVYEFERLGVKKVLIAGVELYVSDKKGVPHAGCLGFAFNNLKNHFDVEISTLTWPSKGKDVERQKPAGNGDVNQEILNQESESAGEKAWQEMAARFEKTVDGLGKKVDAGIKDAVIGLNVAGINTAASCEGHIDRGLPAPWIQIEAPNEPEERFVGEKDVQQKVAQKYGISVEEVEKDINHEAYLEAMRDPSLTEETAEYKNWREETKKLLEKARLLLEEFYKNRDVSSDIRLQISNYGGFRIHNGGADYRRELKDMTDEEKAALIPRLQKYQAEMQEFADFLKQKIVGK